MKDSRITEAAAQARLMQWTLDGCNHSLAVPNPTTIYPWECDLLSVTRAELVHEFEIKRTAADYRADFENKTNKHKLLTEHVARWIPNYFWFVTCDLEIQPPSYAGWIYLIDTGRRINLRVKASAPRLHRDHLSEKDQATLGRLACYRLKNILVKNQLDFHGKEV